MIHSWVRREVGECPADAAPSTAQEQGASIVSAAYTHFESVGRRDEAGAARRRDHAAVVFSDYG
jgi:hypothetical protein